MSQDYSKLPFQDFDPEIWHLLRMKLTESRRTRMQSVAAERTDRIRLALQDIHDPHNMAACLRSAEALGVLHIDLVNTYQAFAKPSSVARGSSHWLELQRFQDIESYAGQLKQQGYCLAAGFPGSENLNLSDVPVNRPLVVIFGNEHQGVSSDWQPHLDYKFTIPMVGMVESLNISVSAALTLWTLTQKARSELRPEVYHLQPEQQEALLAKWACRHSRNLEVELSKLRIQKR